MKHTPWSILFALAAGLILASSARGQAPLPGISGAVGGGGTCAGLVGDVDGTCGANVVKKINGTALSGLGTGILKNTTGTGVPSIAVGSDVCGLLTLTGPITSTACATAIANSINLPGSPTTTTQATGDASTLIATDGYVAAALASLNPAVSVQAATIAVLSNTPTYANGTAGVGATLTAGSVGALTIDSYAVLLNDRVLIKNQASTFQNGVYTLTTLGTGGVAYVLTRATDYNSPTNINYTGTVPVIQGSTLNGTGWNLTTQVNAVGTDALTYTQAAAGSSGGPPGGNVKASGNLTKNNIVIGAGGKTVTDSGVTLTGIAQISTGTAAGLSTCNAGNNNLIWFFTNSAYTTAFCNGTSWSYFGYGQQLTPPASAGWTWDNQGSCTIDSTNGYELLSCPATGATTNSARIRYLTAPATPYTVTIHFLHDSTDADGGYSGSGFYFRDGTGKVISFLIQSSPPSTIAGANPQVVSGGFQVIAGAQWTNSTTYTGTNGTTWPTGNSFGSAITAITRTPACLQISDNGTNLIYRVSADCQHWKQVKSASRTQFFGSGPTQIGWGSNPINNATDVALISWLVQ